MTPRDTNEGDVQWLERLIYAEIKRIEQLIHRIEITIEQRISANEKAFDVAKAGLNEMRGMASDQQNTFLTKLEYEAKHRNLAIEVEVVRKEFSARVENMQNTSNERYQLIMTDITTIKSIARGAQFSWQVVAVVLTLAIAVLAVFFSAHFGALK